MGRFLVILFFALLIEAEAQCNKDTMPIIPVPAVALRDSGTCIVTAGTPVQCDAEFGNEAAILAELLGSDPSLPSQGQGVVEFRRSAVAMGDEGYSLSISTEGIRIEASTTAGAFYAMQSLRQLLPAGIERGSRYRAWRLPCVSITDNPRFDWRGMMIDCSRHFLPIADIKRLIERAASLKLNRFHWHLTDDQGWRLEIRSYPELTRVGAWRDHGAVTYGGYYTQQEVREIVSFAAARHIIVIPEIDMPGHTTAALAAYPWLGCNQTALPVPREWGIFPTVLCIGRESTYEFVETVLAEVADLFPSPWIHVGGDECPRDAWDTCDSCTAIITRNGLPGSYALQWHFTRCLEGMLARLGKIPIGWNEIMAGASTSTLIQAWYDLDIALEAMDAGFQVICSPIDPCYLNYTEDINTLEAVYRFDPLAGRTWPDGGSGLIGVECCLWTEGMPTPVETDLHLFPRLAAFAEAAWSETTSKDWDCFRARLAVHGGRWRCEGQKFSERANVVWDDGKPLTVVAIERKSSSTSRHVLSDSAVGLPVVVFGGEEVSTRRLGVPRIVGFDATSFDAEPGFSPERHRARFAVIGISKRTNSWAELTDSTTFDGLVHLHTLPTLREGIVARSHPNPLRFDVNETALTLRLTLPEAALVNLILYDILGRVVHDRRMKHVPHGTTDIHYPVGSIGAGTYFMRISALGEEIVHKIVLIR
ncbi:MAG: family 20 glycosylhydrolase [Bacteroidota bacterium]|jgi:hexosaminidase|nr:family 20 glycosylhydrolase [Bacteroidota bacterium]